MLGICPSLAITTSTINAIGMGIATALVLIGSSIAISLVRAFIPEKIRVPTFVIVICTFSSIAEMLMHAYVPGLHQALGVYVPLIAINCVILAHVEAFASKQNMCKSLVDAAGMGLWFTLTLLLISILREAIGSGSILGISLFGDSFAPMQFFLQPPGAFILLGILSAIFNAIHKQVRHQITRARLLGRNY